MNKQEETTNSPEQQRLDNIEASKVHIKREEIREGIKDNIPFIDCDRCIDRTCIKRPPFCKEQDKATGDILSYLHLKGLRLPNGEPLIK